MPLWGPLWIFKDLFYFSFNRKHADFLYFKLLLFTFLSFFPVLFPAYLGQGEHLTCRKASYPWTPWKQSGDSMTKPTQWKNPAPVPLWAITPYCTLFHLALVSILRLQSGIFDPLNLFLPCTSATIQKWVSRWKVWRWKSRRESSVPKQRWDAAEKPDHSHWYRHEQKTQLAPSKKPLCCKQFLNM